VEDTGGRGVGWRPLASGGHLDDHMSGRADSYDREDP
jgi:hypothetical protein